jgi:hypothetical protein
MAIPVSDILGATSLADLTYMEPNTEGHFVVLYGVDEIIYNCENMFSNHC